jgi:glutamyl-tRNA reductase
MEIIVIGLDHNQAPVDVREKAAFDTHTKKWTWSKHLLEKDHGEVLILSTCNRSEIYLATTKPKQAIEDVMQVYEEMFGSPAIRSLLNVWKEGDAVRHLYRVAAGFDSMVLGEDQILGQVKQAMDFGMKHKHSGKLLNKLFREGVTFSKKIRHRYGFSETPVSTCYAGIGLLKKTGTGLTGKTVLVTGAGNMGALALRHVLSEKPEKVFMTNRRHDNLLAFLEAYPQVVPIRYEDRYKALDVSDVLITATASPHVVYTTEQVFHRKKPLFVLDLAMPRDVDRGLEQQEGITLFDIDDLRQVVDKNMEHRRNIMESCMDRVEEEVEGFLQWKNASRLDPLLNYVNEHCEGIKQETIGYLEEHTDLSPEQLDEIGRLLQGHLKQSFKRPILRLKKPENRLQPGNTVSLLDDLLERQGR